MNSNEEMLKKNYLELTELKHILRKTQAFFDEVRVSNFDPRRSTTVEPAQLGNASTYQFILTTVKGSLCR